MSTGDIHRVLTRLRVADPGSPIAVFRGDSPDQMLVYFANTTGTRRMIKESPRRLIGLFHRDMDFDKVVEDISIALDKRHGRAGDCHV